MWSSDVKQQQQQQHVFT